MSMSPSGCRAPGRGPAVRGINAVCLLVQKYKPASMYAICVCLESPKQTELLRRNMISAQIWSCLLEAPKRNLSMKQRNLWKENRPTSSHLLAKSPILRCVDRGSPPGPWEQLPTLPAPLVAPAQPYQGTSSPVGFVGLCQGLHPPSAHFSRAGAGTLALAVCLKPAVKAIPS